MASDYNRKKRALRIAVWIAVLAILLLVGSVSAAVSPTPIITSITLTSGVAGMAIKINGQNFGTRLLTYSIQMDISNGATLRLWRRFQQALAQCK
jgi:hypothetical protein